ncbi:hypothetical protein ZTR_04951 [Talaromyces verruculosus]|nr:hypothetical protein ZTR_04951 [Talaromyces verruculosus]
MVASRLRGILSKLCFSPNPEKKEEKPVDQATLKRKIKATSSIFLCDLLNHLEDQRQISHKLDPKRSSELGITFETFNANDGDPFMHPFFLPMKQQTLETHERDLDHHPEVKEVAERLGEWYEPDPREWPEVCYHNAGELCSSLSIVLEGLPYKMNGHEELSSLSDATTWREIAQFKAFLDPRGFDASECWSDEWLSQSEDVWAATDKPHMMATMKHHYALDGDILFVSEIQVMVALMIVRLANGSFPKHNIISVMLFSYTGDKRGRILQPHTTATSFVI